MLKTAVEKAQQWWERFKSSLFGPSIIFEITPRCNLTCRHCYNVWNADEEYLCNSGDFSAEGESCADRESCAEGESCTAGDFATELGTNDVKTLLGELLGSVNGRHITFTGGEPLLRDDVEEIASFLTDNGITVTLITNATLMTAQRAKSLVEAGIKHFQVSILGATPATHNAVVGSDAFDRTVDGIANIRLAGGRVALTFVASALNIHEWPDVIRLSLALGADALAFNRYNPGGRGIENDDALSIGSVDVWYEALKEADEALERYGLPVEVPIPMPPCVIDHSKFPNLIFTGCSAGTEHAYWTLDPVGNLRPCNHSSTILGNVRETPFSKIISSEKCREWAKKVPKDCVDCKDLETCRGGCKASSEVCYGCMDELEPFVQALKKNGGEDA